MITKLCLSTVYSIAIWFIYSLIKDFFDKSHKTKVKYSQNSQMCKVASSWTAVKTNFNKYKDV